jgi:hypothetical protein
MVLIGANNFDATLTWRNGLVIRLRHVLTFSQREVRVPVKAKPFTHGDMAQIARVEMLFFL